MWLWILATLVAYFIKGLCGFANTLIFTSILGFGVNNIDITPVEVLVSYPSNMIMIWQNRKGLNFKTVIPLSVIVLLGSIPGAFLLKNVNAQYIKILCGVVIIAIGIEMLIRDRVKAESKGSKVLLFVVGILSGVLCGLFGIGALLSAYIGKVSGTGSEFKANINAVFVVENTFRIILFTTLGLINLAALKQAAILFPFMLIGIFLGSKSATLLNEKTARKLVIWLLIFSGIMLVVKSL